MITARVTSKGQVTIPKQVRERLGVRAGDDVGFEEKGGLFVVRKVVPESPFDKWVGRLKGLEGRRSDDLVKEARGHGHSR
jgi:antitoxin PrlF